MPALRRSASLEEVKVVVLAVVEQLGQPAHAARYVEGLRRVRDEVLVAGQREVLFVARHVCLEPPPARRSVSSGPAGIG